MTAALESDYDHHDYPDEPTPAGPLPPSDITAEQSVLGALMLSPSHVADVVTALKAEDFYRPAHQLIFAAIVRLWADNDGVDPVLVASRLDKDGHLTRIGGAPYLHTLISTVPYAGNATRYADTVAEKATLRRLADAGLIITQLAHADTDDIAASNLVDQAQQIIGNVAKVNESADYAVLADLIQPTMDELDAIASHGGLAQGVPTGFTDLDTLTNGLHGGQMIIVAARPGVGKSTIGLDFLRSASIKHGKTSAIFSLEMSKAEIVMRLMSAETGIKLADMRAGRMSDADWAELADRVAAIEHAPLFIDDSPNLTMMEISAKARRLKQQHDLQLIVVDYLQLMSSGKKVESRQQEVSEFSRRLKLLAKELDVPVVAISQLNRGPEQRTDKVPQLSDLRESGSLEQDADIVMLLNRPDSQDRDHERAGEADIILAKHRGGPIDTIKVAHQLHLSRFANMPRGF